MKTIVNVSLLAALCVFFLSCEDAKNDPIKNGVYWSNLGLDIATMVTVDEEGAVLNAAMRLAQPLTEDVVVHVDVDQSKLEAYNKAYNTGYEFLSADQYTIDKKSITIAKNETNANPLSITIKPLSKEIKESGLGYAIPLVISSVENNAVNVLADQATTILVVKPTPYANVPVLAKANGMQMALAGEQLTVTDFTVEFLVKIDNLGLNRNNQILFNAADYSKGDGGTDSEIFTRFAADGAAGKWDKFQIKNQGKSYDASFSFENNKWYHIACVNDNKAGTMSIYVNGVLDSSFPNAKVSTTINSSSPRGVRFCGENNNDSYMKSNVQASEIRFWGVARSASQIKNNMYGIAPHTDGLIAYWKLNEGSGNTLNDATGNGHNAHIFGANATWLSNQKTEVSK